MSNAVIITVTSDSRRTHLERQQESLMRWAPGVRHIVVPLTTSPPRVAAARNEGAGRAIDSGASELIFLDVDCLAGPHLVTRYREALVRYPDAIVSGPVTYLPPRAEYPLDDLVAMTHPHPARPMPDDGQYRVATSHDLFWSLSFAATVDTWNRIGGFDERYLGYGGEDTDFAWTAQSAGVPLVWVGGAHAYHQYHPVSSPPIEHRDDIVRNAAICREKHGRWPMTGWLDSFVEMGLIRPYTHDDQQITVIGSRNDQR